MYVEDLKRGTNKDIGPKDIFETGSKRSTNLTPGGTKDMNKKLMLIGGGLIAVLLLWSGVSIYPDWLWFENLDFSPVFWTMLLSKFGFGLIIWVLLILIISLNLYVASRLNPSRGAGPGH